MIGICIGYVSLCFGCSLGFLVVVFLGLFVVLGVLVILLFLFCYLG